MKHIRIRISDLVDHHGDTFHKCKGCALCEEIKTLRKKLMRHPAEKFKHILAKGQDMTKSDMEMLLENEVHRKDIFKALGLPLNTCWELMRNLGLNKRGKTVMAKLTFEEYQDLKAKGWTNKQIAQEKGINSDYISQLKKQWGLSAPQASGKEVKPSESKHTKEDKTAEYDALINELRRRLADTKGHLAVKESIIKNLELKVAEYENISAACDDVENEIDSLREENNKLEKLKVENDYVISNQKYQLAQYAQENEELHEENTALKVFARRYLA